MLMRYKDLPAEAKQDDMPEVDPQAVMHAHLLIGDGALMASDGCPQEDGDNGAHRGYSLSLNPSSVEQGKEILTNWRRAARSPCLFSLRSGPKVSAC